MADGIRIMATNQALRGALLEIPHPTRLIGQTPKLYPIRLDGEGAALVSETVWARMREIMAIDPACPRFLEVGRTGRPPTQTLGDGIENRPVHRHITGVHTENLGVNPTPRVSLK